MVIMEMVVLAEVQAEAMVTELALVQDQEVALALEVETEVAMVKATII